MILKFRAWDKENQIMLDVSLIDFKKRVLVGEHFEFGETNFISFDKIELMQSTGFFDKNGKEIFEGDVVKCSGLLGIIKSFKAMWICSFVKYSNYQKVGFFDKEIEVVGNVYENWELVQEEKDRSCE